MTIKDLKRKYQITDTDLAKWFGYKNANSYRNAKDGKKRLDEGLVKFYEHIGNCATSCGTNQNP